MHFVGNDDNGFAVVTHVPQNGKELLRLLRGEHCGGLVQNQDVRAPVEHLDNFHRLLLGDGHIVDLLVGIHVKAIGIADGLDLLGHLVNVQPTRLLQTQDNVLRRAEHIHQLEMLMNHADAVTEGISGRADHDLLAVNVNLSLIRKINTGEHIHKGGLAAAVFSQQSQNLSLIDVQPYPVVGKNRAEALGNVAHLHRSLFLFQ